MVSITSLLIMEETNNSLLLSDEEFYDNFDFFAEEYGLSAEFDIDANNLDDGDSSDPLIV